ncbi:MAG: hypothetical protein ACI867_000909 [Glaciecola sp.]|jgi:hypothetical protein
MNQETALKQLGVGPETLSDEEKDDLDALGYVIRESAITPQVAGAISSVAVRLGYEQRVFGMEHPPDPGAEMIFAITEKDPVIASLLTAAFPWACAQHVLGDVEFHGGNGNFRSPNPGNGLQPMARIPRNADGGFPGIIALYIGTPLLASVNAPRVVPGSHLWDEGPDDRMGNLLLAHPDEVVLSAPAGSIVVINASIWHASTRNEASNKRYAVTATFDRLTAPRAWPRELPAPLDASPEAAQFMLAPNPYVDGTISSEAKPCWCCGTQRKCLHGSVVPMTTMARGADGVLIPPDDSMAAFGFTRSASLQP